MKVLELAKAYEKFESEFNIVWNKYVNLHKELDLYRGVEITEHNVEKINAIVSELQDTFIGLYPSLRFIDQRGLMAKSAITEHNKFMDDLKATGAKPETVDVITNEAQA